VDLLILSNRIVAPCVRPYLINANANPVSDNVRRFTNLREVTARSPEEVPGPSQATSFTTCQASTRSVRGVTPSLLSDG